MPSKRITISVRPAVAQRIERAARSAKSVSAWMTGAVERALAEEDLQARLLAFCDAVPATAAEQRTAAAAFARITRASRRRGRAA